MFEADDVVVCIDNKPIIIINDGIEIVNSRPTELILNKIYKIYTVIYNDVGIFDNEWDTYYKCFPSKCFKLLSEVRKEKINKLMNV